MLSVSQICIMLIRILWVQPNSLMERSIYAQQTFLGLSWVKVRTVYCYLGLWSVKIRTMSAGFFITILNKYSHINYPNNAINSIGCYPSCSVTFISIKLDIDIARNVLVISMCIKQLYSQRFYYCRPLHGYHPYIFPRNLLVPQLVTACSVKTVGPNSSTFGMHVGMCIKYISVSIPTQWAVAGPQWQLASLLFSRIMSFSITCFIMVYI